MSKNKRSKKHHFLPRHYLKGFTGSSGCFYVYDKREDLILPKPLPPNSTFFENNLNTITLPDGERSDFLEGIYSEVESRIWKSFDNIRQSTADQAVKLLDKMNLFFFLAFLHWRLPSNFNHADKLSKSLFSTNSNLPFFNIVDNFGRNAPEELLKEIRKSPEWSKCARLIAPFAPFYADDWYHQLQDWRFLYSGDSCNWFLVGDNPIIAKGDNDHDPKKCLEKIIFPVSGSIVLVTNSKLLNNLTPEFSIQFGTAILMRSSRFIACHKRDFLEAIVVDYKLHTKYNKEGIIIDELFSMVDE